MYDAYRVPTPDSRYVSSIAWNEWLAENAESFSIGTLSLQDQILMLEEAHRELAAMTCARLDRLEAADRTANFNYNGGL